MYSRDCNYLERVERRGVENLRKIMKVKQLALKIKLVKMSLCMFIT